MAHRIWILDGVGNGAGEIFSCGLHPEDHLLWAVHDLAVEEAPVKVEGGRVMPWFTKKI